MPANLPELKRLVESESEGKERACLRYLSRKLFERAGRDFLDQLETRDLLAIARGALAFLKQRPGDQVSSRIYNPQHQSHGWENSHMVLEVNLRDRPFIFDSLKACLRRKGWQVHSFVHPILSLQRTPDGRLSQCGVKKSTGADEAYELFLLESRESSQLKPLSQAVEEVLGDVVLATNDYGAMKKQAALIRDSFAGLAGRLHQVSTSDSPADLDEYCDFMDWLVDDNFVFLGYREYEIATHQGARCLQARPDSVQGILRKVKTSSYRKPVPLDEIRADFRDRLISSPLLVVTKSNAESTVHRPVRMDYVGIKRIDEAGQAAGENRFLGLFTSKAHSTPVDAIPILRRKLKQVLALDDATEGSHDFKQIVTIFNSTPREELFRPDVQQLHRDVHAIRAIERERGVRVTARPDPMGRGLALMVIMPREKFNAQVRLKIQEFLAEQLEASHVDYNLVMGQDEAQVRFHFFFTTDRSYGSLDVAAIDRQISDLTLTWEDQLLKELTRQQGHVRAAGIASFYADAFDGGYKAETSSEQAVGDIDHLEALGDSLYKVALEYPPRRSHGGATTHLKIYHQNPTLVLSEVFPLLENLGLKILEQISHPVKPKPGRKTATGIDIFRVQGPDQAPLDLARQEAVLVQAVEALLYGRDENDLLNQMVTAAGLAIRQVALLRTYRDYLSQLEAVISRSFITEVLIRYPRSARQICRFFESRFGDIGQGDREQLQKEAETAFIDGLNDVSSLPADQTLRSLFQLVKATVRTNYFRKKPFVSLKIRSADVLSMPDPRPLYEIVVSSAHVEGIHLRGGKVARGGVRWSDRPDDYRTEVLGLMKTQMTKNAVIVPVGSKGGFVLKNPPQDRPQLREYAQQQYQTFVRGLLDITDNIVDGETVQPSDLVIYDEPDPYLVVAADRGTATFSDLANQISREYNFWLGDAFASGGSQGYDHKKEAITARGTWECVARHFRELGMDVHRQPLTVVGIGDMSGDVFGNGLLYSDQIRLVAAFNHLHIFLDPDPDPVASLAERRRLFELPRSSWADYNRDLISEGGGVFDRRAKSIQLSAPVRQLLGVNRETLSGQDLVRAILKAKADLLWNGGIGTYVKAAFEQHSQVGDAGNDNVRVDAIELQARVVGEGGNLGFTQLARVEYCLAEGRMNTDAIDNSAGVDMSDHEVNIKILLQPLVKRRRLSLKKRNQLLREMTDDVSRLVLRDNYHQSLALSLAERTSRDNLQPFQTLMEYLTVRENLDPEVEFLPDQQLWTKRAKHKFGLTRPELAVLLAYTKMGLQRYLINSDLVREPYLQHYLKEYFPPRLVKQHPSAVGDHPLAPEIVALQLTNAVVDKIGITFVDRMIRDTGATPATVIRAALVALEVLDLKHFWAQIFNLDNQVPTDTQYEALFEVAQATESIVLWILLAGVVIDDFAGFVATYQEPTIKLRRELEQLLPMGERKRYREHRDHFADRGVDKVLAGEIASLKFLTSAMGIIDASQICHVTIEEAAKHFYTFGDHLRLRWLRHGLRALEKRNQWETIACGGFIMDLRRAQRELTVGFIKAQANGRLNVSAFLGRYPDTLTRFNQGLREISSKNQVSVASVAVVTRLLLQIADRC